MTIKRIVVRSLFAAAVLPWASLLANAAPISYEFSGRVLATREEPDSVCFADLPCTGAWLDDLVQTTLLRGRLTFDRDLVKRQFVTGGGGVAYVFSLPTPIGFQIQADLYDGAGRKLHSVRGSAESNDESAILVELGGGGDPAAIAAQWGTLGLDAADVATEVVDPSEGIALIELKSSTSGLLTLTSPFTGALPALSEFDVERSVSIQIRGSTAQGTRARKIDGELTSLSLVPEPPAYALAGVVLIGVLRARRRRWSTSNNLVGV